MKKSEVKNNLAKINSQLEKLKEDKLFVYATKGKYLTAYGEVSNIETIPELIRYQKQINTLSSNSDQEVIEQLGLTPEEVGPIEQTILGINVKYWNMDLKNKLEEIRQNTLIAKLESAKTKLEKHLSDDDKFEIDTDGIESLLNDQR